MRPVFARGNQQTAELLLELRKQALRDQESRVAQRFHAIALSLEGYTIPRIAQALQVHRSTVPLWIEHWNRERENGLLEGHRSGRPGELSPEQREALQDILDSGPVAYGLETKTCQSRQFVVRKRAVDEKLQIVGTDTFMLSFKKTSGSTSFFQLTARAL
jgi:transposase